MMSARLFSALRELADGPVPERKRYRSMADLQDLGLADLREVENGRFIRWQWEISEAGEAKLAEMEAKR